MDKQGPDARPDADDQALHFLASEGYLPLALADHPGMVSAFTDLFAQSTRFFALPEESTQKTTYQAQSGPAASEEGYSKIPNEKSIMTVKWAGHCPDTLHDKAKAAWDLSGTLLRNVMSAIARTLDLKPDVFETLVKPCTILPQDKKRPTLLRMFCYDRPRGPDPIVNAQRHKDLGLLSLVVGHSPGLQVLSPSHGMWVPIEEDVCLPPGTKTRSGGLTATLLVGETLAFLTRGKYRAGMHGVVCAPKEDEPFRYSIVYTLRPAVAPVYTRNFESEIVGEFPQEERMDGESSMELFGRIKRTHYNINIAPEIREKQRLEQQQAKGKQVGEMGR